MRSEVRQDMNCKLHIASIVFALIFSGCAAEKDDHRLMMFKSEKDKLEFVRRVLQKGRLADVPLSAREVKATGWAGLFTGSDYVRFKADGNDIENFISRSPGLNKVSPTMYTKSKSLIIEPGLTGYTKSHSDDELYYFDRRTEPGWFNFKTIRHGKKYAIPPEKYHNWGDVIIDHETNTVYIKIVWS